MESPGPDRSPTVPTDPATRRLFGFDLDADAWMGRMRGYCAGPQLGMLGPYQLLATAGRGGQGLVFKARQPRTGREVAIKRLAAGQFSTPEMHARFQREVEAVAALEHPHIVTVYGSEVVDGQPVLVMQWIDGVPFDRWARPMEGIIRPLAEILDAFAKVCDAVHHAHTRGVIHRDLKPTNVLVDSAGEPHVLDFGLARRNDDSSNDPQLTLSGAVLGTPAFSPPEQLRGDARDVDERSDVYSLGAMLYRGLTGSTPVDPQLSHAAMAAHIERAGPRSPSLLNATLDREISAIVLKALQPEPPQRYQSVSALADDVRRYRSGRPVLAHPPGAAYRLHKFVRRNGFVLSVAVAIIGVVAVAIVNHFIQRVRVNDALARESKTRDEAERTDANAALDEVFYRAVKLDEQGKRDEAEAQYRDVLSRRRALVGDDHWSIIAVAGKLARLLDVAERVREAEPFWVLAFNACRQTHGVDHPITLDAGGSVIRTRVWLADYRGAEEICRILPTDSDYARSIAADAWLFRPLVLQYRFAEALAPMQRSLEYNRRKYGENHRYTAADTFWCGELLRRTGDETGARVQFEGALAILAALVAKDRKANDKSDHASMRLAAMGHTLLLLGRLEEAERALVECNAHKYPNNALGKSRTGLAMITLGQCLLRTGRADEGERLLIEGQALTRDPSYMPARFLAVLALIEHYEAAGRNAEAAHWRDCVARLPFREWGPPGSLPPDNTSVEIDGSSEANEPESKVVQLTQTFDAQVKQEGSPDPETVQAIAALAEQRFFDADYAGAEALYRRLVDYHRVNPDVRDYDKRRAITLLYHSICFHERWADAIPIAEDALRLFRQHAGDTHRWASGWLVSLGVLRAKVGDADGARAALEESLKILTTLIRQERTRPAASTELRNCLREIGVTLTELGRLDEAEAALRESLIGHEGRTSPTAVAQTGVARVWLGDCLFRAGRTDEAESELLEGQGLIGFNLDYVGCRLIAARCLVGLYESTGRTAEAAHWRECIRSRPVRDWAPPNLAGSSEPASSTTRSPRDETTR